MGASEVCSTWPVCDGMTAAFTSLDMAIVLGHRLFAVIVGILVAISLVSAYYGGESRAVVAALGAATVLYPLQVAVGAITATGGESVLVTITHLGAGIGIFGGIILALAWTLESRTAEDDQPIDLSVTSNTSSEPDPTAQAVDSTDKPSRADSRIRRYKRLAGAYVRMTKPRLMWLLCLVAAAGMALAAGPDLSLRTVVLTLTGGVLAIGASGVFNNVLERDVDRKMQRTSDRPLAVDLVSVRNATMFGLVLAGASMAAFLAINRLAALLGLTAIMFYSVIYTLVLKPHTVQNTVIGGVAGALPAIIGWAAVTNDIGLPALALAGLIFLWTPAHFYNLAMAYRDDYARGGFPMLPVVRGEAVARKHILLYLGATMIAAVVLTMLSTLGTVFAIASVLLGGLFLWTTIDLHFNPSKRAAMRGFHASNAYLGVVLGAILLEALVI